MDELTRLALAAREGDRVALSVWVRKTQPDVWRLCAYLVDAEAADDLTQDTYLRAFRALAAFRAEASARTWLLAIARRTCADAIRRRQRSRSIAGRLRPVETTPDPARGVDLEMLLDGLPPDRREAFVLTQVLGLSYAEAAGVMGTRVGTIRSRVARARGELVDLLHPDEVPHRLGGPR